MTQGAKYEPGVPDRFQSSAVHRDGDCQCSPNQRTLRRSYFGYGYCITCGKLTSQPVDHRKSVRTQTTEDVDTDTTSSLDDVTRTRGWRGDDRN